MSEGESDAATVRRSTATRGRRGGGFGPNEELLNMSVAISLCT